MRGIFSVLAAAATFVGVVLAQPGPGTVTGDTRAHDPTLCRDTSGRYFLFSTAPGIEIRTSTDRIAWTLLGKVFPNGSATWTDTFTGTRDGNLWAPECLYLNGVFHLWYAASSFGSSRSAIFYARSNTGQPGSFSNQGIVHETNANSNYNAIDPDVFVDGNTWVMTFGSFWSGLKSINLNPSTGKPSSTTLTSVASRPNNSGAVEAPALIKQGSFHYLFTSWDSCCQGTGSTYNIRVGRSSSGPRGPFVDKNGVSLMNGGGTLVLQKHGNIVGPGGADVIFDTDGPLLVYHYYTSSGHFLGINRLSFDGGWPAVV
ncbi:arabinanase [Pterulicium gracile]|uniref:Arabinan endo-1,5-alpha-L-arabinosidase n=1 Tax=Pterulicium gracile TaxID=1884261 RepID=A0A5C3Q6I1_9AGAR|nr:arabinanase [Pterula gracilis]